MLVKGAPCGIVKTLLGLVMYSRFKVHTLWLHSTHKYIAISNDMECLSTSHPPASHRTVWQWTGCGYPVRRLPSECIDLQCHLSIQRYLLHQGHLVRANNPSLYLGNNSFLRDKSYGFKIVGNFQQHVELTDITYWRRWWWRKDCRYCECHTGDIMTTIITTYCYCDKHGDPLGWLW